jgi:uncharacterized membrane protein
MSELVVIGYPGKETAGEVLETLKRLQVEHQIRLDDAVVVTKDDDGKMKVRQSLNPTAAGAAGGALWGSLIGLLFLAPLLGALLGAGMGAVAGALSDFGIDDRFIRDLGDKLASGGSAVFLLVREANADKVLPEVSRFGGEVVRTSLSNEADERLREVLATGGVDR